MRFLAGDIASLRTSGDPRYPLHDCEIAFLEQLLAFTQGGFARFAGNDPRGTVRIGCGGAGGQLVRFVPELDLAMAYVTNTLGSRMAMNDPRGLALLDAAVACARQDATGRGS